MTHQRELVEGAQFAAGAHAKRFETRGGDLADAKQTRYRQFDDEGVDRLRRHHEQAIRLVPVAGDLGNELVRRHPGGHRQADLVAHAGADLLGHARGAAGAAVDSGDVEIGFVERQRLDQRRVIAIDRQDLA